MFAQLNRVSLASSYINAVKCLLIAINPHEERTNFTIPTSFSFRFGARVGSAMEKVYGIYERAASARGSF